MANNASRATIEEKRGLYNIVVATGIRNLEHEGGTFADDLFWAARQMALRDLRVRMKGPVKINITNSREEPRRKVSCG